MEKTRVRKLKTPGTRPGAEGGKRADVFTHVQRVGNEREGIFDQLLIYVFLREVDYTSHPLIFPQIAQMQVFFENTLEENFVICQLLRSVTPINR